MAQKVTAGFEPAIPLSFFEEISAIPRASGHEERIAAYLCEFAKARGLEYKTDDAKNVYIVKPATSGMEDKPAVALQGHTDMVCEKNNDCAHDFDNEGIELQVKNGWLTANGTTLGADDGAAVAIMMALLDSKDIAHPRLECVFTADEEMGMGGAKGFDFKQLTSRRMINLDSEEEGIVTVSCAGGVRSHLGFDFERVPTKGKLLKITLSGLAGGHSGADIHTGRQNAAKLLSAILCDLYSVSVFDLISFDSGSKDNAIPREAEAVIATVDPELATERILAYEKKIRIRLCKEDKKFKLRVGKGKDIYAGMLTLRDTSRVISALTLCHNGVRSMSNKVDGLVEASSNLGIVATGESRIDMTVLSRSCDDNIIDEMILVFDRLAKVTEADVEHTDRYPGWVYTGASKLCDDYCRVYKELTGKDAKIMAIHAGLECGLIRHELPDLDVISIGPDMTNIHTPDEAMELASFERTYNLVVELLKV